VFEAFLLFTLAFWPVLLVAGVLAWWAKRTSLRWLRWGLGLHTGLCVLALLLIHLALNWAIANCTGSALYGFRQCPYVSGSTANYAFPFFIFGNIIAAILTAILIVIGGIAEWRAGKSR
jgi:hypothetical protein